MSTRTLLNARSQAPLDVYAYWQVDRELLFTTKEKVLNVASITFSALFTAICCLAITKSIPPTFTKVKLTRGTFNLAVSLISFVACAILFVSSTRKYLHRREALAAADRFVDLFMRKVVHPHNWNLSRLGKMQSDFQRKIDKTVLDRITTEFRESFSDYNSPYFYYLYPQVVTHPCKRRDFLRK